jgi:hypothetical protein
MTRHQLLTLAVFATMLSWSLPARADDAPPSDKPAQPQASEKPVAQQNQPAASGQGAAVVDVDNDGFLDVFVTGTVAQQGVPSPPQELSEYWIGIDGTSPDDALRAQLELPAGQGLLINQVVENSPAAKAGLKQYDVLLTCHDDPLAQIPDLAKIIEEKKGTALALRLIRGGKRIIIEVTPERRPASQTGETCPAISKAGDEEFARRVWLDLVGTTPVAEDVQSFVAEKREKKRDLLVNRLLRRSTVANKSCTACHANDGDAARLYHSLVEVGGNLLWEQALNNTARINLLTGQRLLGLPNMIVQLQPYMTVEAGVQPLADDVSVSISRKGKEPARVTVRKGDRIWEFSEQDDREKIPEEARALVAPFFSSLPASFGSYLGDYIVTRSPAALYLSNNDGTFLDASRINVNVTAQPAEPTKPATVTKPSPADSALDSLDKQVESLSAQLGELHRAMQELRQSIKPEQGTKDK